MLGPGTSTWDNSKFSTIASEAWDHLMWLLDHWSLLYPSLIHSKANTPSTSYPSKGTGKWNPFLATLSVFFHLIKFSERCSGLSLAGEITEARRRGIKGHILITWVMSLAKQGFSILSALQGRKSRGLPFDSDSHTPSLSSLTLSPYLLPVLSSPCHSFISLLKHPNCIVQEN